MRAKSIGWRGVAAYASLVVVAAGAAVLLSSSSVGLGREVWSDAHGLTAWRGTAVLGYTSGSGIGHVCALVAGLLAGRQRFMTAVLAGAGLGLASLSAAAWAAAPRLRGLASAPVDPGIQHHGSIPVAIGLAFAVFVVAATGGFVIAQARPLPLRLAMAAALAAVAPIAQILIAIELVPRPRPD